MLVVNFPSVIDLQTERLLLRRIVPQDADALFALRTNDQVNQFLDRQLPVSMAEIYLYINKIESDIVAGVSINWGITSLQNNELIGTIAFHKINHQHHRAEIGYMLDPHYWHKGFMNECLQAVITFGFSAMKLHSIEANINPANIASRQLLLKTGFVKEAYFKENYYYEGKFLDSEIYSLINK